MRMFKLFPKSFRSLFRNLSHLTCNLRALAHCAYGLRLAMHRLAYVAEAAHTGAM